MDDPLDVELMVSALMGTWWNSLPGQDAEQVLGEGLVGYAGTRRTPASLSLLRTLALLLGTSERRAQAAQAADGLAAAGVAEPAWAATIGRVTTGQCWRLDDAYGDQSWVLCAFAYGDRPHGMLALVDHNLGGMIKDAFFTDDAEAALAMQRDEAAAGPLAIHRELAPTEARQLLEGSFAMTDMTWQPPVAEDFAAHRALALARVRSLPAPANPAPAPTELGDRERAAIVEQFLASPHGAGLPDRERAEYVAGLIVEHGCDYDDGRPTRVSPAKTEIFLLDWLPRKVIMESGHRDAVPGVMQAWVRWAAARNGLPAEAIVELVEAAAECGKVFLDAYDDPERFGPARLLLQGLDGLGGPDELREALERRMFAMPYFGTRVGDEDYPQLNPADEDERRLLIEGEHPEYHEALNDPSFDGEVRGVDPRLHVAVHEIVAAQLWADDPPEVWQAVRRLRDHGYERHEILHQVGEVAVSQLHGALADRREVDVGAYRAELARLGAVRVAKSGRISPAASKGVSAPPDSVYQIKVSLRGAKPPIWRRLRVSSRLTLAELHTVLQIAMGWHDSHLHQFEVGNRPFAPAGANRGGRVDDERKIRLADVAPRVGARFRYEYDFGDSWEHDIVVEDIQPGSADLRYSAECVAGRRSGPPEDCGGVWGYAELCEVLADPAHPEHQERLDWLGGSFDPTAFDTAAINDELLAVRLRPR